MTNDLWLNLPVKGLQRSREFFTKIGFELNPHTPEDAGSRQEVDALARRAEEAGGTVYAAPGESQGWTYGCGFADPDGHRWNVLNLDRARMPGR